MSTKLDFVDAHVHLWERRLGWYPAVDTDTGASVQDHGVGDFSKIQNRDYTLDDYLGQAKNYTVTKIVHVTAAQSPPTWPDETRYLQAMYEERGYPNGIVGWTDFERPLSDVDQELAEHAESPNFRGVRHHDGIDFESEHTADCLDVMQRRGLIYDTCAHEDTLPAAAKVAQRFDQMTFVLEHTGWPTKSDGATFRQWRNGMQLFAASPNTCVKISGLGMTMHAWSLEDFRPWVEATIEAFGPDRCMFATNFPVDWLYSEYDTLLDAFVELTSGFSAQERHSLFVASAETWYRL